MAAISAGARNLQNRLGSALVSLINNVEQNTWKHRREQYMPMAWSYNRIENIRNAMSGSVSAPALQELFSGSPFLRFLPTTGSVSWTNVTAAIKKTVDYNLALYTVRQLSFIVKTGDIEQLGKWKQAISDRNIGNITVPNDWLHPGEPLDLYIRAGDKNVLDVFAQASYQANGIVTNRWNHLIGLVNTIQNTSDLYVQFPQIGRSTDLRTSLQDGLKALIRVLGDGKVANGQAPSGIMDYYAMLLADIKWLRARGSYSEPNDVQQVNGLEKFNSLSELQGVVEARLVSFINDQTTWMKDGLNRYDDLKHAESKERLFLIICAVVSAVASVGSIGFFVSNSRAVATQIAGTATTPGMGWSATNLPALGGSVTLFINNAVSSVLNGIRAANPKIATDLDIKNSVNAKLVEALNAFDGARQELVNKIYPDMFTDMYCQGGQVWDPRRTELLYTYEGRQTHEQHLATADDIATYVASRPFFDEKNYVAFLWTDAEFTNRYNQTVRGRAIVGIKSDAYRNIASEAASTIHTNSLDLPGLNIGGSGDDHLVNDDIGYDGVIDGGAGDDVIEANDANNTLIGGDGDDSLFGGLGDNSLSGGSGQDELTGGDGNETLSGGDGDDVLQGGDGNDVLDGGAGDDSIDGGAGDDSIQGGAAGDKTVSGGDGNDTIDMWANTGNSSVSGDAGNDNIVASQINASSLSGGDGNDTLYGENGADTLTGGSGDDILYGNGEFYKKVYPNLVNNGRDSNLLDGGDGNDQLFSAGGNDTLLGGAGNDSIQGLGGGNLSASGGDGNDYIDLWANTGRSSASGDNGNDNMVASQLNSASLSGGAGNDTLYGENGSDTLTGDAGNDVLYGNGEYYKGVTGNVVNNGRDSNRLDGGDGNDQLFSAGGNDTLLGGAGNDSIQGNGGGNLSASGGDGDDYIDLWANTGRSSASGDNGNDNIVASQLNASSLFGGAGNDTLYGENGSDTLTGDDGNDVLYANGEFYKGVAGNVVNNGRDSNRLDGGDGNDQLFSASGNDTLLGGAGNDSIQGNGGGNLSASGGDGDDYIDLWANSGRSSASGDAGNDNIVASYSGASSLSGGVGNDTLYGENGSDTLTGDAGNDVLYANGEFYKGVTGNVVNNGRDSNRLDGGDGNDQLFSAGGNDTLLGGAGNDSIQGIGGGNLSASGGDGDDYIDLWANTGRSSASGDNGNDNIVASQLNASSLSGGVGNDTLYGENGSDTLTGDDGNDVLYGNGEYTKNVFGNLINNGSDGNRLDGGAGDDKIYGAGGNDTIIGGAGINRLTGGAGADKFVFKPSDGGTNYILDYNEKEGDSIFIAAGTNGTWIWTSQTQVIDGASVDFWKLSGSSIDPSGKSTGTFDNIFVRKDGYVNLHGDKNVQPLTWPGFGSNY